MAPTKTKSQNLREWAFLFVLAVSGIFFASTVVYLAITAKKTINDSGASVKTIDVDGVKCIRLVTSEGAALSCDWR
jgi:hypothetical protein